MLFDVTLPLLLNRAAQGRAQVDRALLERPNPDTRPQLMQLARLRARLAKLAGAYRPAGTWSSYEQTCTYSDAAEDTKKGLVRRFLETRKPRRVLDLGCNTGDYSRIAAAAGAEVIAADGDHDAVEILYRRLRAEPAAITPMVLDIMSPSPGVGFLNRERPAFLERLDVDCVLALALLHHLLISGNLSLAAARDLLHTLTRDLLVLEFVPTDDPMFRRMLQFRRDLYRESISRRASRCSRSASDCSRSSRFRARHARCCSIHTTASPHEHRRGPPALGAARAPLVAGTFVVFLHMSGDLSSYDKVRNRFFRQWDRGDALASCSTSRWWASSSPRSSKSLNRPRWPRLRGILRAAFVLALVSGIVSNVEPLHRPHFVFFDLLWLAIAAVAGYPTAVPRVGWCASRTGARWSSRR